MGALLRGRRGRTPCGHCVNRALQRELADRAPWASPSGRGPPRAPCHQVACVITLNPPSRKFGPEHWVLGDRFSGRFTQEG